MRKRIPILEQNEHSECGLTSVCMILNYFNIKEDLNNLRDKYGVPKGGNTLLDLQEICTHYGLSTKGVRIKDYKSFKTMANPCICFWDKRHFVVFEKVVKNKIVIVDPAQGKKVLSYEEFAKHFSNVILEVTKTTNKVLEKKKNKSWEVLQTILKTQKLKIGLLILFTLLTQCLSLFVPMLTTIIVDKMAFLSQNKNIPLFFVSVLAILFCSNYLLQVSRGLIIAKFQKNFEKSLMKKFMRKVMNLPLKFFVNRSTGDLIFRSNLTTYIQQILSQQMITTGIDVIFLVVYFSMMIYYSPRMALVTAVTTLIIATFSVINSRKLRSVADREMLSQSKVQNNLVELFEGMETVKSLGMEEHFYTTWENNFCQQLDIQEEKGRYSSWIGSISTSIQFVLPFLITSFGVLEVQQQRLTIGELVSFNSLAVSFLTPIITLLSSFSSLLMLKSYFRKINDILLQKTNEDKKESRSLESFEKLELKNVSFRYSYFEQYLIKRLNLTIKNGEKVAIVGPSGSGKSTLLKLISGMYQATDGCVKINGIDVNSIEKNSLNKEIAIVNQTPAIFNTTLYENLILKNKSVTLTKFDEAITKSRVDEIIRDMPLGFETQISEGGMNLSGGQKQRISIARALIKDPSLLILDEPTSSLDNISDNFIMNNIINETTPCIVVSHRLNTIKHFDRIIVMDKGCIVEDGQHSELMAKKGLYHKIYSGEKLQEQLQEAV